ncbi:PDR/VanB family oxidoreductase [Streptomyces sp. JNUCC 63]
MSTEHPALVITRVATEVDGIISITFEADDGSELPAWEPGAHIDVQLPSGLSRQYSLCGSPADRRSYTIAVLEEVDGRGGSRELHAVAQVGARLGVRVPRNNFPLEPAESYLFLAGGIGITPILPMVAAVDRAGANWHLVYGGRRRATMAFRDVLSRYGDRVDLWPEDERGRPDLSALMGAARPGTLVYTCGPTGMIDAVATEHARHAYLPPLRLERFCAAGPVDTTGDAFEVTLARSGQTVHVGPGTTILDAVRQVLPDVPHSCEEGYCGECEARVLEGEPDHRDDYLMPHEQEAGDRMMVCVSRCKGRRLVLDL